MKENVDASLEINLRADRDWLFVVDRDAGVGGSERGAAQAMLDDKLMNYTAVRKKDQIF